MSNQKSITMNVPDVGGFITYFESHHSVEGFDVTTWARWGIILLIALLVAFWHQRQNRTFHEYIRNSNKRTPISDRLSQLAYNRSFEILALFVIIILGVVYYDTRVNAAEQQAELAQQDILSVQDELAAYEEQMALKDQQLQEAQRLSGMDAGQEQKLDALKMQFENLFVNYYVLKSCGLSTAQDFHIMNSALMYELNTLNAPAGIRQSIVNAALGTYQELYAELPCASDDVGTMQDSVRNYLRDVVEKLPDQ